MGFGKFLKKVINPLSPIKAIAGAAKGIVKGEKGAVKKALGATVGLDIDTKKKKKKKPVAGAVGAGGIANDIFSKKSEA